MNKYHNTPISQPKDKYGLLYFIFLSEEKEDVIWGGGMSKGSNSKISLYELKNHNFLGKAAVSLKSPLDESKREKEY